MAGIIGGLDNSLVNYGHTDGGTTGSTTTPFVGMAPKARILSVKVANQNGATDVSQILAAIDWVLQHRKDNGMNIRVLNLSFGTDSTQPYTLDPLDYAAEVKRSRSF